MSRVAVIGAGPLGLMAMKNLKEEGFDVFAFETREYVGGLWRPSPDDSTSVLDTTILMSTKFRSAVTDFPFPSDFPIWPTAKDIERYWNEYCDHFDLRARIQFSSKVVDVHREGDQWALQILSDGVVSTNMFFDKLVVASGGLASPKTPILEGIDHFEGKTTHSINFNHPEQYEGKNVLVVGMHASSCDVAASLVKNRTKSIYLSHRHGVIMIPRYDKEGRTSDQMQSVSTVLFMCFLTTWFPQLFMWMMTTALTKISKNAFPKLRKEWNFWPSPSLSISLPMVGDEIYQLLLDGHAEPVAEVQRISGPRTVQLKDGSILTDIDAIVYCTGYYFSASVLPEEFNPYPIVGVPSPRLYRNMFLLHDDPAVRNSLVLLGHVAVFIPGFLQHELTTIALSQIWAGKSHLPPLADMQAWTRAHLSHVRTTYHNNTSNIAPNGMFVNMGDHMRWLDEVAGFGIFDHFGWFKWRAWAFWWRDRELYRVCAKGILAPSIWRLFDMGKRKTWRGARAQILKDNRDAQAQAAEGRRRRIEKEKAF